MERYSEGCGLFSYIKEEISKKFSIEYPVFIYNETPFDNDTVLIEWINKQLKDLRWVQYKHLQENLFEIKDISPSPSNHTCNTIIDTAINKLKKAAGYDRLYFKRGTIIYSEKQARQELLFELRYRFSEIFGGDVLFNTKYEHPIYELDLLISDELGKQDQYNYYPIVENTR